EVVGVRGEQPSARQIVVDRLVDRHDLRLADVDADDGTDARTTRTGDARRARLGARVVEAHPVDDGTVRDQPEQPRTRIARLRERGDGAHLDMTEPERPETRDAARLLVETRSQTERRRELEDRKSTRLNS